MSNGWKSAQRLHISCMEIVGSHHQLKSQFRFNRELGLFPAGELKIPVKILANLLENGGANLRKSHFSVLRFSKISWGSKHISNRLRNHGSIFVDYELKTLSADQFYSLFLLHFALNYLANLREILVPSPYEQKAFDSPFGLP